jgi:hypothetical protein
MLVHYFDRTGQTGIDPRILENVRKGFNLWKDTARDAVRYLAKDPAVHPRRIGLLGFSLGSALALSVASEKELGVAAARISSALGSQNRMRDMVLIDTDRCAMRPIVSKVKLLVLPVDAFVRCSESPLRAT